MADPRRRRSYSKVNATGQTTCKHMRCNRVEHGSPVETCTARDETGISAELSTALAGAHSEFCRPAKLAGILQTWQQDCQLLLWMPTLRLPLAIKFEGITTMTLWTGPTHTPV